MIVYVAEISGRAIAAFNALDAAEAGLRLQDEGFRINLRTLLNEGRPLWDGRSKIDLRQADTEEAGLFEAGRSAAILAEETDGFWLMYLVPVRDPIDEEDDDDDDDDWGDGD